MVAILFWLWNDMEQRTQVGVMSQIQVSLRSCATFGLVSENIDLERP